MRLDLNLLLNLLDDLFFVYHETIIMFILAMVIGLLLKRIPVLSVSFFPSKRIFYKYIPVS